jgi:methyltransferase (TIGR00027 family)
LSTDEQWDVVTGVGLTALAVAAGRAAESARLDALITDPYAARLVAAARPPVPFPFADGAPAAEGADEELWNGTSDYVGLRSRIFDDYFLRASGDGIRQVVILASGLDTRAYRLSWPSGTVCYELDQPAVLDFKAATLDAEGAIPACDHHLVPVDLRHDWGAALEAAGFDASRPTAWLAEGLLPYLPPDAEARLFEEVSRLSAAGSRFAVERIDNVTRVLDDPLMKERSNALGMDFGSLFPAGDRAPVQDQLTALGWELEHRSVPGSAAALGRPEPGLAMFGEHVTHTFGRLARRSPGPG